MASTYTPIATYTVTGSNLLGTTGVTFTSISSTYTDLIIVQQSKTTAGAIGLIRIGNGSVDTGNNYSLTYLAGNGSSASSGRYSNADGIYTRLAHNTTDWGTYITHLQNYSNTTTYKTALARYGNVTYGATEASVALWRSTSAINTVQCMLDRAEYFVVGTTFTLYGVKSA